MKLTKKYNLLIFKIRNKNESRKAELKYFNEFEASICLLTPKSGNVVIQTRIIERSALNGSHVTVGT